MDRDIMKCRYRTRYLSKESAMGAAQGGSKPSRGVALHAFWCEEHQCWHIAKDPNFKIKPCPKCGGVAGGCICLREAQQEIGNWDDEFESEIDDDLLPEGLFAEDGINDEDLEYESYEDT